MKTVDEIISTWSIKEQDQFADLIKECKEREIKISGYSQEIRDSLYTLHIQLHNLSISNGRLLEEANKVLEMSLETLLKISPVGKVPN